MSLAILPCTCKNKFQDTTYGNNQRVMNQMKTSKGESDKFRCTVCGTEKGR